MGTCRFVRAVEKVLKHVHSIEWPSAAASECRVSILQAQARDQSRLHASSLLHSGLRFGPLFLLDSATPETFLWVVALLIGASSSCCTA